jgi:hypothetical protein
MDPDDSRPICPRLPLIAAHGRLYAFSAIRTRLFSMLLQLCSPIYQLPPTNISTGKIRRTFIPFLTLYNWTLDPRIKSTNRTLRSSRTPSLNPNHSPHSPHFSPCSPHLITHHPTMVPSSNRNPNSTHASPPQPRFANRPNSISVSLSSSAIINSFGFHHTLALALPSTVVVLRSHRPLPP